MVYSVKFTTRSRDILDVLMQKLEIICTKTCANAKPTDTLSFVVLPSISYDVYTVLYGRRS